MRARGIEPPRVLPHKNLNLARLPIPPRPRRLDIVARSEFAEFYGISGELLAIRKIVGRRPGPELTLRSICVDRLQI